MTSEPLWKISEVMAATGGELYGDVSARLDGVSIDSRAVAPGDIFVAIKGERFDGNDFAASALENGAGLAIVSRLDDEMKNAGPVLLVDDPLAAMEKLGRAARARTDAKVIAVTGSVGKTTTKDALRLALSKCGRTHAATASFNNHWGVPLTLCRMPRDTQYAVFEIGMNHAGEIEPLVKMVRPHVAIITAVAECHLGHFSSLDDIAKAKAEIFAGVEPGGAVVLPADSAYFGFFKQQAKKAGIEHVTGFGQAKGADARLERSVLHGTCSCVTADILGDKVTYRLGAPGAHVVANSLAVLAAAKLAGADLAKVALALADLAPPTGRGERLKLHTRNGAFLVIDESYNANPASMRAALALLGAANPKGSGRRIAVLGDMLELGENSAGLHGGLVEPIEAAGADLVFACGPEMKNMWDGLAPFRRAVYGLTSRDLLEPLLAQIRAGDVVMIKGSLGSAMGLLVKALASKYSHDEEAA